jgi:glycosyltransferase involved in cell wall biosynthesis
MLARDRRNWDVIHANQPHLQSVAALLAAGLKGATFVVTYHSLFPATRTGVGGLLQRRIHRILLEHSDHVVFVSEATRRELGRPSDLVIPNGVDLALTDAVLDRRGERDTESFVFAFAGRQTRSKGFFDFLRAFQNLADSTPRGRVRLLLIGDTTREESEERARLLAPISALVEDLGAIFDRAQVLANLARAHAFVLPSYREGMPLGLMEAMAVGCVPVVSPVGGIPEVVDDCVTGLFVPPGNRQALTGAMRHLLERPGEVAMMAAAAQERIRTGFSLRRTVDAYCDVYSAGKAA